MFTSMDKAIVALLSGGYFVASNIFGWNPDALSPELFNSMGALLTTFLVWLVPNK